jgi:AcrR family transcriptional regulator
MTTADRKEREKLALRAKILEVAREQFLENGVESVTMRRIADAIEYTPPVLYSHFEDKAALLRTLCEEDMGLFHAALQRAARIADPVERIRKMGRHYIDFGLEHPHHYRLLFMTVLPEAELAAREERFRTDPGAAPESYALLHDAVAECIGIGRFAPEYKDPERVAQVLWAAVHGLVSLWIVHGMHGRDPHVKWRAPKGTASVLLDVTLDGLCRGGKGGPL